MPRNPNSLPAFIAPQVPVLRGGVGSTEIALGAHGFRHEGRVGEMPTAKKRNRKLAEACAELTAKAAGI